ncbi:MAG: YkgJ family cysteine cluster protein [Methanosarcinaceae archaeon]|nr:YkgJ family cysteine cluster protein [Methanosarcinaceae archaeon]MDD4748463.1 YkgJ family cysteine cluster protein [Methanosarcinaceae archaeon]
MINVKNDLIEKRLAEAKEELENLRNFPEEKLAGIIQEIGFKCELCGRCCTKEFNDYVFLLDRDVAIIKEIEEKGLVPAPYPEFCDQKGRFYGSGYALKTKADGTCVFLEAGRCKIYGKRPTICRVYPYMLHREADAKGAVAWRQLSGLNKHGSYYSKLGKAECKALAEETIDYEEAYLLQLIHFFEALKSHFRKKGLKHVQRTYDKRMRAFLNGKLEIEIFVYCGGGFESQLLKK